MPKSERYTWRVGAGGILISANAVAWVTGRENRCRKRLVRDTAGPQRGRRVRLWLWTDAVTDKVQLRTISEQSRFG